MTSVTRDHNHVISLMGWQTCVENVTNSELLKFCYLSKAKAGIYCLHNLTGEV